MTSIPRLLASASFLFFLVSCGKVSMENQPYLVYLHEGWTFGAEDDTSRLPARVPGCIHTDLLENHVISDPFHRMNETGLQWIDKQNWLYETRFDADPVLIEKESIFLHFKGLDTYADVYLNDSLILHAGNMFREWRVEVKALLKARGNSLKLIFHSPIKKGLAFHDALAYTIPVSANDQSELGGLGEKRVSPFIRKAPYHFGWDWGPRLVTSGIWRPVFLEGWDMARIDRVFIQQDSLVGQTAHATFRFDIHCRDEGRYSLSVQQEGKPLLVHELQLMHGLNQVAIPLSIQDIEPWWPAGLGDPRLYTFDVSLSHVRTPLHSLSVTTGFRTIRLVQIPDSLGGSFHFVVNGIPVFAKGANYIPLDIFPSRVKAEDYRRILMDAAQANMNMIRVWGGGVYEDDHFYYLCDSLGLMVWQDFMFACSMYPGDEAFLENVRKEAMDNLTRLRNHPCIALWCGNNENLIAWEGWGWKKETIRNYGTEIADLIWKGYDTLFHRILPLAVQQCHPGMNYWPSSPGAGWGQRQDMKSGNQHYWMVWWGGLPFESYETEVGRFMAEYGFQSFPLMPSVKSFTLPEDHDIYSAVMQSHQRSSIGNISIQRYMEMYYYVPEQFNDFLYVSQLLQARGIKTAMESHRRNLPYCMGSLYWQLNDCWPAVSWSGIDYYGEWKALHHQVKRSFNPLLLSPILQADFIELVLLSDEPAIRSITLNWQFVGFDGVVFQQGTEPLELSYLEKQTRQIFLPEVYETAKRRIAFHAAATDKDNNILTENILYFLPPKALELPMASITYTYEPSNTGCEIRLLSDKLAMGVHIMDDAYPRGRFSDNFFDLIPGQPYTISYTGGPEPRLRFRSLRDTYE